MVASAPLSNLELRKLCLSYWACWPAVALLKVLVAAAPRIVALPGGGAGGGDRDSERFRSELQRAMLVVVLWLQVWQGSRLLLFSMHSLFPSTKIMEYLAASFGSTGKKGLAVVRSGGDGLAPSSLFSILNQLRSTDGVIGRVYRFVSTTASASLSFALIGVTLIALAWLVYGSLRLVGSAATIAVWFFAALDSADTMMSGAQEMYNRKLCFWVLAAFWQILSTVPYIGALLRLFTPFVFSLCLVAGEPILNYVVFPVLVRLRGLATLQGLLLGSVLGRNGGGDAAASGAESSAIALASTGESPLAGSESDKVAAADGGSDATRGGDDSKAGPAGPPSARVPDDRRKTI